MADTHKDVEGLKKQLREIQTQIQKISQDAEPEVANEVRKYIDEASESLKTYFDQTAENVKKKWTDAKDSGKETTQKANDYAKENPWHVAALGLVVGAALSSLLSHRSSKE
ncbi:MAG: hypothetical protein K0S20_417 [Patescibacteria group bacterium]|jgi:ElaB/YqjD/DUF883 family membrane-anchored ribosome-binding protein|nr:hypothetical protein [Patescibacteria group bacterium]